MGISIWKLVLVLMIVFVIFGAGKLPRVMGDIGKGIRAMREGLKSEDEGKSPGPEGANAQLSHHAEAAPAHTVSAER